MNELMKQYTFGVEIEFTGMSRKRAASIASKYFQSEVEHRGGTYDTYSVVDHQGRTWKFMYDSSIHAQRKNGNWVSDRTYKVEMVTPILHYPDIELLQELVRHLQVLVQYQEYLKYLKTNSQLLLWLRISTL